MGECRSIAARVRYITQRQPAWERTIALCSATRQTITSRAIHDPKSIAVRIGRKCIHQACLYLRWSQNMQQYSNLALTDTRSHRDSFPILPLPNTDHPPINLPRSQCHTNDRDSIFTSSNIALRIRHFYLLCLTI